MARDDGQLDRMLRINGQTPTAREKWQAFHRLWRLSHGLGIEQDRAAVDCFRVLFPNWRAIRLLNGDATQYSLVNTSAIPKFLRKRLLEHHRRTRLYQNHPEWVGRDKETARLVRDQHGIEVTPSEVAEARRRIIATLRLRAAELDITVPEDDDELLQVARDCLRRGS